MFLTLLPTPAASRPVVCARENTAPRTSFSAMRNTWRSVISKTRMRPRLGSLSLRTTCAVPTMKYSVLPLAEELILALELEACTPGTGLDAITPVESPSPPRESLLKVQVMMDRPSSSGSSSYTPICARLPSSKNSTRLRVSSPLAVRVVFSAVTGRKKNDGEVKICEGKCNLKVSYLHRRSARGCGQCGAGSG